MILRRYLDETPMMAASHRLGCGPARESSPAIELGLGANGHPFWLPVLFNGFVGTMLDTGGDHPWSWNHRVGTGRRLSAL